MPKGKHKGKHRVFTNPEQLAEEEKREERAREWRQKKGEESSEESGSESGSESSSSEDEAKMQKPKGPQLAVENPNRVVQKNKKLSTLTVENTTKSPAQLSRREREAIEKERARQHYQKMHAQGKTAEAQSDLARLAIIRKQREEAAKKREEEKKAKEAAVGGGKAKR